MKSSMKTALCGVVTALSVVCMLLTTILPIATYCCAMLAGMCITVIVIEINPRWAVCVYFAVSLLSILIVPDKEAVVYFVAFFGYYPILKRFIEQRKSHALQWIMKLIVFNASVTAAFFVTIYLLSVPKESYTIAGIYLPWVFLILGDVIFVLYDIALNGMIAMYIQRFRKYIFKRKW